MLPKRQDWERNLSGNLTKYLAGEMGEKCPIEPGIIQVQGVNKENLKLRKFPQFIHCLGAGGRGVRGRDTAQFDGNKPTGATLPELQEFEDSVTMSQQQQELKLQDIKCPPPFLYDSDKPRGRVAGIK